MPASLRSEKEKQYLNVGAGTDLWNRTEYGAAQTISGVTASSGRMKALLACKASSLG
jgi:hypothetical protein